MRNLKRVLSTIMAIAMLMSVVVFSASADTVIFNDKEKITHTEAVDMAVALKIILGYEDGTFRPEGDITRAEMTKMIAVLMHGGMDPVLGTNPSGATFTDIRGHWAEKYIEFCVAQGIVAGMGDGTFAPDGKVTGTQAAKMLLVALGFDAQVEDFNTSNWATRIGVCAADRKLFQDVNVDPNAPLSRDNAAQMIWNALQAFEVEYTTEWYMDANGNPAARQVAKNKSNGTTGASSYVTLLEDKYECNTFEGQLILTNWDKANKVFKYSFQQADSGATGLSWVSGIGYNSNGANPNLTAAVESSVDYSEFFSMNVKVVVKKDNKTILGMVTNNSVILAEGVFDDYSDVAGERSVRLDGTKYRAEEKDAVMTATDKFSILSYAKNAFDTGATRANDNLAKDCDVAWMVKLIDLDGNGRFDHAVYTPFNVGQVTYVGSESITISNAGVSTVKADVGTGTIGIGVTGNYEFDLCEIYEGVAKDDFVVVYNAANTPYDTEVIEKMETASGELTRLVAGATNVGPAEGEGWYIDGTAYFVHPDAAKTLNTTVLLGNEYDVYYINGFAFGQDLGKSNYTMDDVLMVYTYGISANGVAADQAKVYFAKDGSSAIINVDELYIKDSTTHKLLNDDADDQTGVNAMQSYAGGKLFTFTEKNGMYVLEEICSDNKLGFSAYTAAGAGITASTKVPGTLDNKSIADEAVVFVLYNNTGVAGANNKVKVLTGAAAKDLAKAFGTSSTYLTNKSGNLTQVQLAVVAGTNQDLPTVSGIVGNYGYIVSNNGTVKIDGTTYNNFSIYTKDGLVTVNTEDKDAVGLGKNTVITFSDLGDGEIDDVEVVSGTALISNKPESGDKAGTAAIIGFNGNTAQFQYGGAQNGRSTTSLYTFDDDTVFLQVKTLDKVGKAHNLTSAVLTQTAEEIGPNHYRDNCVYVVGDNDILKLVIVDIDNSWLGGYGSYVKNNDADISAPAPNAALGTLGAKSGGDGSTAAAAITYTYTGTDRTPGAQTVAITLPLNATISGAGTAQNGANATLAVTVPTLATGATTGDTETNTYSFVVTAEDGTTVLHYKVSVVNTKG